MVGELNIYPSCRASSVSSSVFLSLHKLEIHCILPWLVTEDFLAFSQHESFMLLHPEDEKNHMFL
jgi:hypothetical protein